MFRLLGAKGACAKGAKHSIQRYTLMMRQLLSPISGGIVLVRRSLPVSHGFLFCQAKAGDTMSKHETPCFQLGLANFFLGDIIKIVII